MRVFTAIFFILCSALSAQEVCLPVEQRGVYLEVPYVVKWNIKSDCSTKAKNDLNKLIRDSQVELDRCVVPTPVPTASPTPAPTAAPDPNPVPDLLAWKENLIRYGQKYCDPGASLSRHDYSNSATYYDGAWVYQQTHKYLALEGVPAGRSSWLECAELHRTRYKNYLNQRWGSNTGFRVQGYEVFPHGLYPADTQELSDLAHRHAFAAYGSPILGASPELMSEFYQRETAFLLQAYTFWAKLGNTDRDEAFQTVLEYTKEQSRMIIDGRSPFVKPFFIGLTAHALIDYNEFSADPEIPALIKALADRTWQEWKGNRFTYVVCRNGYSNSECSNIDEAPDTNMLIAPMFAWLYSQGFGSVYRDRADQIFVAGIERRDADGFHIGGSCIACNGKQFSQNYRLAFRFLEWRQ